MLLINRFIRDIGLKRAVNRLGEAGPRRQFDHGQTSSFALSADSCLRSYRHRDLSTNFPTFVQLF